jgi:hypothetical protein
VLSTTRLMLQVQRTNPQLPLAARRSRVTIHVRFRASTFPQGSAAMKCRRWLAIAAVIVVAGQAFGQVVAPPPPAEYDVELRYRIRAPRNQHIEQYSEMTKSLDAAGLKRDAADDDAATDANAERIHGKLPASAVEAVLAEPHVRSMVLTPAGFQLPEADGRVTVRITLPSGLARDRQQLLHSQANALLAKLGFVPRIGYDHRGFTSLFGTLPVESLPNMVADLRYQPGGWLAAETSLDSLPEPLRGYDPLRIVEVIAEPKDIAAMSDAVAPEVEPGLEKLSPDLRALLREEGAGAKPTRLEVVLFDPLRVDNPAWRAWLQSAGTITVEGQLGQTVTIFAPAAIAKQLAPLPQVAAIRLPARASDPIPSANFVATNNPLRQSHLDVLHGQNARGQGIAVAIIDHDFAGVKRFIGRSLPSNTLFIDLTAERNPSLEPDPLPNDRPGRGTLSALAAAQAAPQARLILVRVNAAAAYQIGSVARFISGDAFRTEAMDVRHSELLLDNERLRQAREALNEKRRVMSDNFDSEVATQKERIDLQKRLADQQKQETDYSNRLARFIVLERGLLELKSAGVVACNMEWNSGFASDGTGPLAQYLDGPARLPDRGRRLGPVTWLQAAGDTHGQTWAAPAWDADGNGALEFAGRSFPMPAGKWTRELNFLGWQPNDGEWKPDLPAGTKVRLNLQWTEAHDSTAAVSTERYRTPLNDLRPVIVKQRDPNGKTTSSDDLVVISRAVPLAQMIGRGDDWATFEQTIEFTVDQPGRYAVRLEAKLAASTAPPEIELPPASRRKGEVFPRLFVDSPSRDKGRPVFIDFRTVAGGVSTPGDARSVVVVGAADAQGKAQPYSALGSSPSLALVHRPSVIAFDELTLGNLAARGTATANGFAAGMVAAMLSGGGPASHNLGWLNVQPGGLLQVPLPWIEQKSRSIASQSGVSYPSSPVGGPGLHNR